MVINIGSTGKAVDNVTQRVIVSTVNKIRVVSCCPWLPLPFVALAGSHVLKLFAWRALLFGTSFLRSPLRWWVRPLLVYADG